MKNFDNNKIPLYLVAIINGLNCIFVLWLVFSGTGRFDVAVTGVLLLFISTYYLLAEELVPYVVLIIWYSLLLIKFETSGLTYDFGFGFSYELSLGINETKVGFDVMALVVILLLLFSFPGSRDRDHEPTNIDMV